jgi:hypothetical protein
MTKGNQQNKRTKSYEGNNHIVPIFLQERFFRFGHDRVPSHRQRRRNTKLWPTKGAPVRVDLT